MKEVEIIPNFMLQVSNSYSKTGSLQRTADEVGISYAKVRKILITLGEYETEFSLDIAKRRKEGMSILEIATEMKTSTNRISAYLPYEKAIYDGPIQSEDAQKSKAYRKRMQVAKEKFVANQVSSPMEDNDGENQMGTSLTREEKNMSKNLENGTNDFTAVHLHLELKDEFLNEDQKRMLRRYGESSTGNSICRDILIPSDMPLHNLHYAIQSLFGWQNSHLRCFRLPDEIYNKLTGSTVKGWAQLVGILFQPPSEADHDIFWDDDYQKGSIKTWLKKKFTGPYFYGGEMENVDFARNDIRELLECYPIVDVKEPFHKYYERSKKDKDTKMKIIKRAPMIELTLEEMNSSIIIEGGTESLLERLEVTKVLAAKDEETSKNDLFPAAQEIIYNYDFGDNWIVTITRKNDCKELLEQGYISNDELLEAEETVLTKHKPVCIHKDGVFVLDDVGGLHGFANYLGTIYESDDKEERQEYIGWAKSLGWNPRKVSNKMVL